MHGSEPLQSGHRLLLSPSRSARALASSSFLMVPSAPAACWPILNSALFCQDEKTGGALSEADCVRHGGCMDALLTNNNKWNKYSTTADSQCGNWPNTVAGKLAIGYDSVLFSPVLLQPVTALHFQRQGRTHYISMQILHIKH